MTDFSINFSYDYTLDSNGQITSKTTSNRTLGDEADGTDNGVTAVGDLVALWGDNGVPLAGVQTATGDPVLQTGSTYRLFSNDGSLTIGTQITWTAVSYNYTCYLRGTRIMTTSGEVVVEDLQPGDILVTRFGPLRPVKWIGRQSFNGRFLGQKGAPVCFRASSIAPGVPARDLCVSPAHSMVIDDTLVLASLLVNGLTITQQATSDTVDYFHLDLGVHDCLIADGAWGESYAEQDNRASFHNADSFAALFPDHQATYQEWCLPQINSAGPDLVPILAKLAERYPAGSFTDDPDLHLMADGTRIDPSVADGKSWHFAVPAGVSSLRLVSRACSPVTAGLSCDPRTLGFRITRLTVSSPAETRTFKASHRQFGAGVHGLEEGGSGCWRWTNGDCRLPEALLAGIDEPVTLVLSGNPFARFLAAAPVLTDAAAPPRFLAMISAEDSADAGLAAA